MKKLICVFSVIFLFIGLPIAILYNIGFSAYLSEFFKNQIISIMATVLALNFAISASLQAILLNLEMNHSNIDFTKSRKEINHNLLLMIIIFAIVFFLQIFNSYTDKYITLFLTAIKITFFSVYFYAFYEISSNTFKISNLKK